MNKIVKTRKKNRRILFQVGIAIIVLFVLTTALISRMITYSGFLSSLASIRFKNGDAIDEIGNTIKGIPAFPWLLDYLNEHADDVDFYYDEDSVTESEDPAEALLGKSTMTITREEIETLSEEDQYIIANELYQYITFLMYYTCVEHNLQELLIMRNDKEGISDLILFDTTIEPDGLCHFGEYLDHKAIESYCDRFMSLLFGEFRNIVRKFPGPDSVLAFRMRVFDDDEKTPANEADNLFYYNFFNVQDVYTTMTFVDYIRHSVMFMLILVGAVILILLYLIVLRPLSQMKRCVVEYEQDKDADKAVKNLSRIRSRNEIGLFADEFSSLAKEMEVYTGEVAKLAGEAERVSTELGVATRIQADMLPQVFPEQIEFSLYALMNPAKEVGGDFYDFYMIDEDHLAMTIADVSGKGIPAALFMAVSKTILKNRTLMGGSPAEILYDANMQLCEGNDSSMFVTVWHGILTLSTGRLVCANAGHEYPLMRLGGEPIRLIKTRHSPALGVMEGIRFRSEKYQLEPGDAIFVYTDGVPEATAADESMFTTERLEDLLKDLPAGLSPQEVLTEVQKAVNIFVAGAPQFDDLTMLGLLYKEAGCDDNKVTDRNENKTDSDSSDNKAPDCDV